MSLRFRQVHLDFHTSEHIPEIGEKFDKVQFQKALETGCVDSITLFSKCHHGWSYHPTEVNEIHPHLKFDLLGKQLEACKEIGVNAPVYISAGLDEKEAVRHPEWLSRFENEATTWVPDFLTTPGFHLLCFNTGYFDLLVRQVEEVMEKYAPSGIFLDISSEHPCYCAKCRNDIMKRGKDPRDFTAVMEQAERVYNNYALVIEKTIRNYSDTCTIFHNAGHITRGRRDLAAYNTHLELESLPTGGWGYSHFPMSAAYVANLGKEYLGMTGKFHSTWGEFGGFKHPNALRYETALSLAFGAKCSIGDQLHPTGKMDEGTYELIGAAYREVKEKEKWCQQAENYYDIAVLGQEAVNSSNSSRDVKHWGDIGANRILLEGKYLYRFIDLQEDFKKFKLIILPDTIKLTEELSKQLSDYISNGGKILASGTSGLDSYGKQFLLNFGAAFIGENSSKPDYMITQVPLSTGNSPHIMYEQGYLIEVTSGTEFAARQNAYFNRDILHFSSHQHTPNDDSKAYSAAVMTSNTAYISWNIFSDYGKMGSLHQKEIVVHAIDTLLGSDKTVSTDFIDKGILTLTKQTEENRYINHLLFAHTTNRGTFTWDNVEHPMEVIEGIVPVYDVKIILNLKEPVRKIYLAPQIEEIPFKEEAGKIYYTVPKIECHQMIVIDVAGSL